MTQRDDAARMRDMLAYAREAVTMIAGRARQELASNRILELALVRLVEIVGEAASRVSPQTQARRSSVPWAQARGMRNRLIHGYDMVDLDLLWDTIDVDFPALIALLEQSLREDPHPNDA